MRRIVTALALVAFTGAVASAATQAASKPATTKSKSTSTSSASSKARTLTATGTIESYDATANTLTLKTAKDTKTFTLDSSTKVYMGSKSESADHLKDHVGSRGTVKYTESDGKMTAASVRVSGAMKKRAAR
jgi:acid phosphatase class B